MTTPPRPAPAPTVPDPVSFALPPAPRLDSSWTPLGVLRTVATAVAAVVAQVCSGATEAQVVARFRRLAEGAAQVDLDIDRAMAGGARG